MKVEAENVLRFSRTWGSYKKAYYGCNLRSVVVVVVFYAIRYKLYKFKLS